MAAPMIYPGMLAVAHYLFHDAIDLRHRQFGPGHEADQGRPSDSPRIYRVERMGEEFSITSRERAGPVASATAKGIPRGDHGAPRKVNGE